jgi:hypothetical protein
MDKYMNRTIRGPYKKAKDRHSVKINVYFTPAEKEAMKKYCEKFDLCTAAMVREAVKERMSK